MWSEETRYDAFESFVADNVSTTHTNFSRARIETDEVRSRFEAGRSGDGFVFTSYGRANIYQGPQAA